MDLEISLSTTMALLRKKIMYTVCEYETLLSINKKRELDRVSKIRFSSARHKGERKLK